jgi:hypothetical protein
MSWRGVETCCGCDCVKPLAPGEYFASTAWAGAARAAMALFAGTGALASDAA